MIDTMINGLIAVWTFGFITVALMLMQGVIYLSGARLRAGSKYKPSMDIGMMEDVLARAEKTQMREARMQGLDP